MEESVYLVARILFFNISLSILSSKLPINESSGDNFIKLANVSIESKIEYLNDNGESILFISEPIREPVYFIKRNSDVDIDTEIENSADDILLPNYHNSNKEDQASFHGHRKYFSEKSNKNKTTEYEYKNTADLTDKITNAKNTINHENPGTDKIQDPPKKTKFVFELSTFNYLFLKILRLLKLQNLRLMFQYTEIDHMPVALQLLFHVPLILTGIIIFIVVLTLDPEFNSSFIKKEIDKLPLQNYNPHMDLADCSVCLEAFFEGQPTRILGCSHGFHRECIDNWLINSLKCPVCRRPASSGLSNAQQVDIYQAYYYL